MLKRTFGPLIISVNIIHFPSEYDCALYRHTAARYEWFCKRKGYTSGNWRDKHTSQIPLFYTQTQFFHYSHIHSLIDMKRILPQINFPFTPASVDQLYKQEDWQTHVSCYHLYYIYLLLANIVLLSSTCHPAAIGRLKYSIVPF